MSLIFFTKRSFTDYPAPGYERSSAFLLRLGGFRARPDGARDGTFFVFFINLTAKIKMEHNKSSPPVEKVSRDKLKGIQETAGSRAEKDAEESKAANKQPGRDMDIDEEGNTNQNNNIEDYAEEEEDPERMAMEESPKGRFKRFNEELGSGAYKTVYKAIDQDTGREVAWNVIKLRRLPKGEKKRIMEEINLIKNLKHDNIIHFISAWVVRQREEVVFITEMVTGGSLHQYLKRIKHPRLKVLKTWASQILKGLQYLHEQDTPIIHRDIKCDNVFINSNSGEIRIGDLGLSTTMKASHAKSVLGTPEFMAPELYEEHYGQGVDIYAFGMCMLEMVTLEQPYKECQNPAQVYKKVSDGVKPQALDRIKNQKVVAFISQCIAPTQKRPTARQLLESEFLMDLESEDNNEVVALLPSNNSHPPHKHSMITPITHPSQTSVISQDQSAPSVVMHSERTLPIGGAKGTKPPTGPAQIKRHSTIGPKNGIPVATIHQSYVLKKTNTLQQQAVATAGASTHQMHHWPDLHVNTQQQRMVYPGMPNSAKYHHNLGGLAQQYQSKFERVESPQGARMREDHSHYHKFKYHNAWKRPSNSSEEDEEDEGNQADEEKSDFEIQSDTGTRRKAEYERGGGGEADQEDNTDTDGSGRADMRTPLKQTRMREEYERVRSSGSISSMMKQSPTRQPRKVDIMVNYENQEGVKEIAFQFDMDRDSAIGVVEEMAEELQLNSSEKHSIIQQIQRQVSHKYKLMEQQHEEILSKQFEARKHELFGKLDQVEKKVTEIATVISSMDHVGLKAWLDERRPEQAHRVLALQQLLNWRKRFVDGLKNQS